ncbi:hypothetical protein ABPG72_001399 [Tetrahymena utriculariae]
MIKQDQIIQGTNNSYKILEIVGTGNISQVYKAVNEQTYDYFAIKVISKTRLGDQKYNLYYEREILILKKLMKDENQHQNIIRIYDIFESNDSQFVVFELLKDGNLIEYLFVKNMQIDEQQAIDIIFQVTKAICHLHKLKIMHRDIKPENILLKIVDNQITCKLIDFGVSSQNENSLADSMVGSISYISKEILLHKQNYNEKCDVWSLGCLFHELITGSQLFCGENIQQIYQQIISFEKYNYNSKWSYIIQKCLEVDIEKRVSSQQLLDFLQFEYKKYDNQISSIQFTSNQQDCENLIVKSINTSTISIKKNGKIQNKQSLVDQMEEQQNERLNCNTNTYNANIQLCSIQDTLQIFSNEIRKDALIQNTDTIVTLEFSDPQFKNPTQQTKQFLKIQEVEEEEEEKQIQDRKSKNCGMNINQSKINIIDEKYASEKLWDDLSKCQNKYYFNAKLKNIQLFFYPKITNSIKPFKKNQYLDKQTFHYSLFHLIILIQFLKMFQTSNQKIQNKLNDQQTSSLKKLIVDIYNLNNEQKFKDISKKNLLRLLSGLSELVQEKPLEYAVQSYYRFLKFKRFQSTMQELGKCIFENKREFQNVFSISNIQKRIDGQNISKIDEITIDTENNKKFQIILNNFQHEVFQKLKIQINMSDIEILKLNE